MNTPLTYFEVHLDSPVDNTTVELHNVVVRTSSASGKNRTTCIFLNIDDNDEASLSMLQCVLGARKSQITGRWYLTGYFDPECSTSWNGYSVDNGAEYFIPCLEYVKHPVRNGEMQLPTIRVRAVDIHMICMAVFKKEEPKMATTTGKKYYDYTKASSTYRSTFGVKKVIFNPPATIVFWKDGSKTVVKCSENDFYDPLAGIAFALMRKVYGKEYRHVEKYAKEYEKQHPSCVIDVAALADTWLSGYLMSDKETHALAKDDEDQ